LIIAVALFYSFLKRGASLFPPAAIFLYALLFVSLLSLVNTLSYKISLWYSVKFLTSICMYLLAFNSIHSKQHARAVLWSFLIAAIIPMLVGYHQYFTGTSYKRLYTSGVRVASLFVEVNPYGEFLCLIIFAAMILLLETGSAKLRVLLGLFLSSALVSLMLSLNRSSWIALTLAVLAGFVLYRRKLKLRWILVPMMIIAVLFSSTILTRFGELEEQTAWGTTRNTFYQRVTFWKNSLVLIGEKPLVGHGIGTAGMVLDKHFGKSTNPHNDYVRLSLEAGLPASLCYISFLAAQIIFWLRRVSNLENWRINFPILVAVMYFIIISAVQNVVYNITVFPMMLGLLGVAHKYILFDNRADAGQPMTRQYMEH